MTGNAAAAAAAAGPMQVPHGAVADQILTINIRQTHPHSTKLCERAKARVLHLLMVNKSISSDGCAVYHS